MIYEKKLVTPVFKRRSITRKFSLFRDKTGALLCHGLHFREEDGALVTAEGTEMVAQLPVVLSKIYTTAGHSEKMYAYLINNYLTEPFGRNLYRTLTPLNELVCYRSETGETVLLGVDDVGIYGLVGNSMTKIEGTPGGKCACIAHERLLTAQGELVRWSQPLNPENWTQSMHEAGYLRLPSRYGDIFGMIPFKESVYLFRETGITALRMQGDELAFCAEEIPCACGRIVPGSAKDCGDRIVFLSENGLYTFDGSRLKLMSGCGYSEIGADQEIIAQSSRDKYYASVTLKSGEACIWVVEPEKERGHFIRVAPNAIGVEKEFHYGIHANLYRLTDRGIIDGKACSLTTEPSLLGLSPQKRYLESIMLEGQGLFTVSVRTEKGAVRTVSGEAGTRLVFSAPVCGMMFSLNIETLSGDAKLKSVTFDLREESA